MPKEDTQWKPGQSGNPSGRPKGTVSIVEAIRRKLQKMPCNCGGTFRLIKTGKNKGKYKCNKCRTIVEKDDAKRYVDFMVDKIFKKALIENDTRMMIDIVDRIDGKPKQGIELDDKRENKHIRVLEDIAETGKKQLDYIYEKKKTVKKRDRKPTKRKRKKNSK